MIFLKKDIFPFEYNQPLKKIRKYAAELEIFSNQRLFISYKFRIWRATQIKIASFAIKSLYMFFSKMQVLKFYVSSIIRTVKIYVIFKRPEEHYISFNPWNSLRIFMGATCLLVEDRRMTARTSSGRSLRTSGFFCGGFIFQIKLGKIEPVSRRAYFVDATYVALTVWTTVFIKFFAAWISDVAPSRFEVIKKPLLIDSTSALTLDVMLSWCV